MKTDTDETPTTIGRKLQALQQGGLPRLEAQMLMLHALGLATGNRGWLLTHDDRELPAAAAAQLAELARRRQAGEPMAYLTGWREFHGLALRVDKRVLDPRPDTETLVDWALELLPPGQKAAVLDLGTGSGAIALAVAHARPLVRMTAVDASGQALAVARANGKRLGLAVDWRQGDWFAPVAGQRFDLALSNPPYIATGDAHLQALQHEPPMALQGGSDGLDAVRAIIAAAPAHLTPGGWLLLEHGWDQGTFVRQLLASAGFSGVQSRRDLAGHQRCSGGQVRGTPI